MAAIPKKHPAEFRLKPPPKPSSAKAEIEVPDDPIQAALVEHAINGSVTAFEQLVQSHHVIVRLFLARYVNCQDTVDDLAQDVFVVAFRDLKKFRKNSKFSTWLLGIARFKALGHLRNHNRWRKKNQQYIELKIAEQQIGRIEKVDLGETIESQSALQTCLNRLPEPSRQLVNAYYYQGQNSDEIGGDTGQKSGTIRMKLMRIRSALLKCIRKAIQQ